MRTKSYGEQNGKGNSVPGKPADGERRRKTPVVDGVADWETVNGDLVVKAVAALALDGGALRLGYTRDGGAYAIGIYGDGEPFTEYLKPNEDMDEYLRGLIRDYGRES